MPPIQQNNQSFFDKFQRILSFSKNLPKQASKQISQPIKESAQKLSTVISPSLKGRYSETPCTKK